MWEQDFLLAAAVETLTLLLAAAAAVRVEVDLLLLKSGLALTFLDFAELSSSNPQKLGLAFDQLMSA